MDYHQAKQAAKICTEIDNLSEKSARLARFAREDGTERIEV